MPPLIGQAGYSGLAERPQVSLGLNKVGFGELRPSGLALREPKWCEMVAGADLPSSRTRESWVARPKELITLYFCALGKVCPCLEESEVCVWPSWRMEG